MRRVRVLYVVGNFVAGGAERHLLELWSRIDRDAFDVTIACFRPEGAFTAAVEALGWPVHDLGVRGRLYGGAGVRAFVRLVHLVLRTRPDVVHGYLFGPNLFAVLAGRLAGVPAVVVAKRNVDAFETPRQRRLQRLAHRLASHVTAVSDAVAGTVTAMGVPRARVTVIPNGVDVARFEGRREGVRTPPVIGTVGCLAPRKDHGTLLEALALLAQRGVAFRAVLVGEGPSRAALEAQSRGLGLGTRVAFLGERDDIPAQLRSFDVFVLSSREEGIPNALLEAMADACPAVATAVGGTPEVLEDGVTGWLVPAAAPGPLADALAAALAAPAEAGRRGAAARAWVIAHHGIDTMVRAHEAFYRRVSGLPVPDAAAAGGAVETRARPVMHAAGAVAGVTRAVEP